MSERSDRKALRAAYFIAAAWGAMMIVGMAALGERALGSVPVLLLVTLVLSVPLIAALAAAILARGPILTWLAALFAACVVGMSLWVLWDALRSENSTAAIAFFFLPLVELAAFVPVLVIGLLADALLGAGKKPE